PYLAGAREDVGRAGLAGGVVRLVAVDAGRVAVFADGTDRQRVAVGAERDGVAELIAFAEAVSDRGVAGVGGRDVRLLRPRRAVAHKDIDGARFGNRAVLLVAVDAGCVARLVVGRHGHRVAVAAERDGRAEVGAFARRRRLDVGLLRERRAAAREHI